MFPAFHVKERGNSIPIRGSAYLAVQKLVPARGNAIRNAENRLPHGVTRIQTPETASPRGGMPPATWKSGSRMR
jgi:hypothetical protein